MEKKFFPFLLLALLTLATAPANAQSSIPSSASTDSTTVPGDSIVEPGTFLLTLTAGNGITFDANAIPYPNGEAEGMDIFMAYVPGDWERFGATLGVFIGTPVKKTKNPTRFIDFGFQLFLEPFIEDRWGSTPSIRSFIMGGVGLDYNQGVGNIQIKAAFRPLFGMESSTELSPDPMTLDPVFGSLSSSFAIGGDIDFIILGERWFAALKASMLGGLETEYGPSGWLALQGGVNLTPHILITGRGDLYGNWGPMLQAGLSVKLQPKLKVRPPRGRR